MIDIISIIFLPASLFYLSFLGLVSMMLDNYQVKGIKNIIITIVIWVILLVSSTSNILIYPVSFLLFASTLYSFKNKMSSEKEIFIIVMFAVFFYLGLGAVRLIYLTGFPIAIMGAYFIVKTYDNIVEVFQQMIDRKVKNAV